jgi:hypothetical protein
LRQSFQYDGRVLEAPEFWEQHAFTNLVPRLLDDRRKKPADWVDARDQFPLILAAVRPKRILIVGKWGCDVLKNMSDTCGYVPFGATDGWEMRFGGIPAVGIPHLSYWNRRGTLSTNHAAQRQDFGANGTRAPPTVAR